MTRDTFDLVSEVANPLPTMVIAELLGVQPERQADFKRWSDDLMTALTGVDRGAGLTKSGFVAAAGALAHYLAGVVAERRAAICSACIGVCVCARVRVCVCARARIAGPPPPLASARFCRRTPLSCGGLAHEPAAWPAPLAAG